MSKIFTYIFIVVVLTGVIAGSLYLYKNNTSQNKNFDSTIQTYKTKVQEQLRQDVLKLKDMKDTYSAQGGLNGVVVNSYTPVEEAFHTTDGFFKDPNSAHPELILATTKTVQTNVDTLRQKIQELFIAWQNTILSIKNSSTPNPILITEANSEIALLQTYISQLQSIVQGLGPDSGLTPQQILADQTLLQSTQNTLNTIANNLSAAEAAAGVTNTSTNDQNSIQIQVTPITPTDIQQQQQVVNQQQQVVNQQQAADQQPPASDTSNPGNTTPPTDTGGSVDSSGSNPSGSNIPPPPPNTSGTPQLIEGANTY